MSDPLDGWEFGQWGIGEDDCVVVAWLDIDDDDVFRISLWEDGDFSTRGRVDSGGDLPTLRAVLDELERRARDKWGDGWGQADSSTQPQDKS